MTDSILQPSLALDPRFVLLEQLVVERLAAIDLTQLQVYLVDHVNAQALVWLAEQFSLFGDGWEMATSESAQRALIKASIEIHQHKGTPWAVKRMLALLGYGDAVLIEYPLDPDHWWEYGLEMENQATIKTAALIRKTLASIVPARCVLGRITSRQHILHNSTINFDGQYSYGVT